MTAETLPEDPVGLIGQALAMGAEFPGPAQDVLLSWVLKLDAALDPIAAAAVVLKHYGIEEGPEPPGELGKLVRLLRETAACPPGRSSPHRRGRGRPRRD